MISRPMNMVDHTTLIGHCIVCGAPIMKDMNHYEGDEGMICVPNCRRVATKRGYALIEVNRADEERDELKEETGGRDVTLAPDDSRMFVAHNTQDPAYISEEFDNEGLSGEGAVALAEEDENETPDHEPHERELQAHRNLVEASEEEIANNAAKYQPTALPDEEPIPVSAPAQVRRTEADTGPTQEMTGMAVQNPFGDPQQPAELQVNEVEVSDDEESRRAERLSREHPDAHAIIYHGNTGAVSADAEVDVPAEERFDTEAPAENREGREAPVMEDDEGNRQEVAAPKRRSKKSSS
jgi:hypothetical protein